MIDFDAIPRSALPALLRSAPKAELHIHIEGSLEPAALVEACTAGGVLIVSRAPHRTAACSKPPLQRRPREAVGAPAAPQPRRAQRRAKWRAKASASPRPRRPPHAARG